MFDLGSAGCLCVSHTAARTRHTRNADGGIDGGTIYLVLIQDGDSFLTSSLIHSSQRLGKSTFKIRR